MANTRMNQEYRFNIINLLKPDSLYNLGMRPLIYSEKTARFRGVVVQGGEGHLLLPKQHEEEERGVLLHAHFQLEV